MRNKKNNQDSSDNRDIGISNRLSDVEKTIGTRKDAAIIAGVSEDMLRRYIKNKSRIALEPAALMCEATNVSLDWLWSGTGEKLKASTDKQSLMVKEDTLIYQTELMTNDSNGYRPPPALVSLIIELVSTYGMSADAAPRIIKVMSLIEDALIKKE